MTAIEVGSRWRNVLHGPKRQPPDVEVTRVWGQFVAAKRLSTGTSIGVVAVGWFLEHYYPLPESES